jgi:hypothetical protein
MKVDGCRRFELWLRKKGQSVGPREDDGGEVWLWKLEGCFMDFSAFKDLDSRERREMWRAWMGPDVVECAVIEEVAVGWEPSRPVVPDVICGNWQPREPRRPMFDGTRKLLRRAFGVRLLPKLPAVS